MQKTEHIWHDGKLLAWDDAGIHSFTHSLHYGGAAFEGIRAYETDKGPAIFRLDDHTKRLLYSISTLHMELPYGHEEINQAICDVVASNKMTSCYIRPIAYFGDGKMGLSPIGSQAHLTIACWPWGQYLPFETVDIKTTKYRKAPALVTNPHAKLSGNYLNSILAKLELRDTKYHEGLLLDIHGFIAEGPGENFFMVKDGKLYTPELGSILPGITRATVIEMAQDLGIQTIEAKITLDEAYYAEEAFFCGTAAEISPIGTIDDHKISDGKPGKISTQLRQLYNDTVRGKNPKMLKYLTFAKEHSKN